MNLYVANVFSLFTPLRRGSKEIGKIECWNAGKMEEWNGGIHRSLNRRRIDADNLQNSLVDPFHEFRFQIGQGAG